MGHGLSMWDILSLTAAVLKHLQLFSSKKLKSLGRSPTILGLQYPTQEHLWDVPEQALTVESTEDLLPKSKFQTAQESPGGPSSMPQQVRTVLTKGICNLLLLRVSNNFYEIRKSHLKSFLYTSCCLRHLLIWLQEVSNLSSLEGGVLKILF